MKIQVCGFNWYSNWTQVSAWRKTNTIDFFGCSSKRGTVEWVSQSSSMAKAIELFWCMDILINNLQKKKVPCNLCSSNCKAWSEGLVHTNQLSEMENSMEEVVLMMDVCEQLTLINLLDAIFAAVTAVKALKTHGTFVLIHCELIWKESLTQELLLWSKLVRKVEALTWTITCSCCSLHWVQWSLLFASIQDVEIMNSFGWLLLWEVLLKATWLSRLQSGYSTLEMEVVLFHLLTVSFESCWID